MLIHSPCIITPRLMAGVRIGNAFVSIDYKGHGNDGRTYYRCYIDIPGVAEHVNDDLSTCGGGLQQGLASLLTFMSACAESVRYARLSGHPGENALLFPESLHEWLTQNSDEISMLATEIEESETDVIEE